jgi:hypothetical protein
MRSTWKDRRGTVHLDLAISVRSTGWSEPARIGGPPEDCHEAEREDEREIVAVELGGVTVDGLASPLLFHRLAAVLQEQVDGTDEMDVDWEEACDAGPSEEYR